MSIKSRTELKNTFVNSYIPDEIDFANVFDSYIHQYDDVLMIDIGGNVGIGTNTPAEKLHVVGNVQVDGNINCQNLYASGDVQVDGALTADSINIPGMAMIPVGGIIMWSGSTIPTGWALCDGLSGTPDLRGRFIVGVTNSDNNDQGYSNTEKIRPDYNLVGKNGGMKEVTLTASQSGLQDHIHSNNLSVQGGQANFTFASCTNNSGDSAHDTRFRTRADTNLVSQTSINGDMIAQEDHYHGLSGGIQGVSQIGLINVIAHENRPPYYVLAFIMKT